MPGIYLMCAANPLDGVVLEGTGNNAVCSGLPHFGAFDGHFCQMNMHQPDRLAVGLQGVNIKCIKHFSLHIK